VISGERESVQTLHSLLINAIVAAHAMGQEVTYDIQQKGTQISTPTVPRPLAVLEQILGVIVLGHLGILARRLLPASAR
jgi:hypothetical protein